MQKKKPPETERLFGLVDSRRSLRSHDRELKGGDLRFHLAYALASFADLSFQAPHRRGLRTQQGLLLFDHALLFLDRVYH